ncbi:MAG: ABC transporter ATP-binding protein [Firmicutes bacterium]|nr:ABC transporter ATP-binding protein [Bacillota bacterium]
MLYTIEKLTKTYGEGEAKITALDGIDLEIPPNKIVAILGASGSGKSTLLNILGCMDLPTAGAALFKGEDITRLNKKQMTEFRRKNIGFVFQSYNLLPDLTALENVEFSTELAGISSSEARNAMDLVGLSERLNNFPKQLSGGEQQRVSIARAIAKKPEVLLCDEPTGALDLNTGIKVLDVLVNIHKQNGTSVLLITHNSNIAAIADIVISLRSGKIANVQQNTPIPVSEVEW